MTPHDQYDSWNVGQTYEDYMGRWSRLIAADFVAWLNVDNDRDWLEIGCGTGALTKTVIANCAPRSIVATDASADFVLHAREAISSAKAQFTVADALRLPLADGSCDVVASALVLNFVVDRTAALLEMQRVLRIGGVLSFYVWDYPGGGIEFIDRFWKAAAKLDPEADALNEASRFGFCTPEGLEMMCDDAGLATPEVTSLETLTEFKDFDAFWHPFTRGAGPAPGYCASLPNERRAHLKHALAAEIGADRPVRLKARAHAVKVGV